MVGKVNLPPDADERKDVKGSASGAPGLTAVDEERAASMADEGGAAGSVVESQERRPETEGSRRRKRRSPKNPPRSVSERGSTPRERRTRG